ncbi:MAG: hypothetical protein WBA24_11525, partial [Geitlerinemataceae cyanobacterium]
ENPKPDRSSFGMMTNGDEIVFVKLTQTGIPYYDVSRVFALLTSNQELYSVLQILQQIGRSMLPEDCR